MNQNAAVVTGGSSGLGLSIATRLAAQGRSVCIVSRNQERLDRALAQLVRKGNNHHLAFCGNIADEDAVCALFSRLENEFGTVDLVFNVAGIGRFGNAAEINRAVVDEVLEANLIGLILMSSHAFRTMSAAGGGAIVNIISTAALTGRPKESVYCAAKWGARGFTEALRAAAKGTQVRVLSVFPGGMKTAFWSPECGTSPDTSSFMDADDVARRIVDAATGVDSSVMSEFTISRP